MEALSLCGLNCTEQQPGRWAWTDSTTAASELLVVERSSDMRTRCGQTSRGAVTCELAADGHRPKLLNGWRLYAAESRNQSIKKGALKFVSDLFDSGVLLRPSGAAVALPSRGRLFLVAPTEALAGQAGRPQGRGSAGRSEQRGDGVVAGADGGRRKRNEPGFFNQWQ